MMQERTRFDSEAPLACVVMRLDRQQKALFVARAGKVRDVSTGSIAAFRG